VIARRRAFLAVIVTAAVTLPLYRSGVSLPWLSFVARGFAAATAGILRIGGADVTRAGAVLRDPEGSTLAVTQQCTAWPQAAIFLAGVLALAPGLRRKGLVAVSGLVVLAAVNVLRLVLVFQLGRSSAEAFFWVHRVAGEAMLVAIVVALWWIAASEREVSGEVVEPAAAV